MRQRTHHCGQLRNEQIGQRVVLAGWVNGYRDHGGVVFIDLRDREGLTQLVFHPDHPEAHASASRLRHEDVIEASGEVVARGPGLENPKLATGTIEVRCDHLQVLGKSATPPFLPDEAHKVSEEHRLRYRYIDLRRPRMQEILRIRHRVAKTLRDAFDEQGFLEVETPFLCRSTPEGARDFLVPSRLQRGAFYALPQSPQLFKQILMAAGAEKYVQIVRCFRDEDPRADRQAEFTQLDVEMSFVEREEVMAVVERAVRRVWGEVLGVEVGPIPRMAYAEAMGRYGSDRPDLRFGLELHDIGDLAARTTFNVFRNTLSGGGAVMAVCAPGGAALSRKQTDELAEWAKTMGVGGLPVTRVAGGTAATGVAKFLEPVTADLLARVGAGEGDLICFGVAEKPRAAQKMLGELRLKLAQQLKLIPEGGGGRRAWLWVVDFPMVEWNAGEKRWDAMHHPFTSPLDEDLEKLESDPGSVRAKAYDIVLNGSELGGGSIRIHREDVQKRVFALLGIDEQAARQKFGFLLDALRFGAPPHGGIALGLDRMVMHLAGTTNIRDVIAFPKTQTGADLMTEAPAPVDLRQLEELGIRVIEEPG